MYPDWLSLTGKGYVASMYKQYGKIVSPMGCRAFLSPWYERGGMHPADDKDQPVFVLIWEKCVRPRILWHIARAVSWVDI